MVVEIIIVSHDKHRIYNTSCTGRKTFIRNYFKRHKMDKRNPAIFQAISDGVSESTYLC